MASWSAASTSITSSSGTSTTAIRWRSRSPRAPKDPSEYKVVGKIVSAESHHGKGDGPRRSTSPTCRVKGMLHARVIRPPNAGCAPGARSTRARSRHPRSARRAREGFLAVVADREWDAVRAAEALKVDVVRASARRFRRWPRSTSTSARRRRTRSGAPVNRGDVDAALARASRGHHGRIRVAAAIAREHGPGVRRSPT